MRTKLPSSKNIRVLGQYAPLTFTALVLEQMRLILRNPVPKKTMTPLGKILITVWYCQERLSPVQTFNSGH